MNKKKFDCSELHERQKKLVHCMWCGKKIGLSFQERLKNKVDTIPLDIKQQVLNLIHEGKTLGEVRKIVNLEIIEVGEIIIRNIDEVHFIRKEARA